MSIHDDVAITSGAARPPVRWRWLCVGVSVCWLVAAVAVAPAGWLVKETVKASKGGETPKLAVFGAMEALDRWADDDLGEELRCLSARHADQLRTQLGQLRHQILSMGDVRMETHNYQTSMTSDDKATVTVDVRASLAVPGHQGLWADTEFHEWRFATVKAWGLSSGWKVDAIQAPDLCRIYFRCP